MEQFALNAQHAGAINHLHSFHFSDSAIDVVREVRNTVLIIVAGWAVISTVKTIRAGLEGRR